MDQNQAWLDQVVVTIPSNVHDIPNRPLKTLPKYVPNKNASLE